MPERKEIPNQSRALPLIAPQSPSLVGAVSSWCAALFDFAQGVPSTARDARLVRYAVPQREQVPVGNCMTD